MRATACLIQYLDLLEDRANMGAYVLQQYDLSKYMKLDASAVKALNLVAGPKEGVNKNTNLFGLLNKCKTAQGSRMLGQWIKQPLMDISEIRKSYYLTIRNPSKSGLCILQRSNSKAKHSRNIVKGVPRSSSFIQKVRTR